MSEDLLRQAEQRHQRRPKSRQSEEIVPLDVSTKQHKNTLLIGDKLQSDGACLPPIRHFGNYDKPPGGMASSDNHDIVSSSHLLSPVDRHPRRRGSSNSDQSDGSSDVGSDVTAVDRPRTPRRRVASHTEHCDGTRGELDKHRAILPFIRCRVYDKDSKALISTVSQRSTLSHRLLESFRGLKSAPPKTIEISGQDIQINFSIDDSALHDLVLGIDFVCEYSCLLDFSAKLFTFNCKAGGSSTPFLTEEELPLKYRNRPGLTSSI